MRTGRLAVTSLLPLVVLCAMARATTIIQHAGNLDPATEGWTISSGIAVEPGDGSVPPALEPAWRTIGGLCGVTYEGIPTALIDGAFSAGWTLEVGARLRYQSPERPSNSAVFYWTSGWGSGDERAYVLALWEGVEGHLWFDSSLLGAAWWHWPNIDPGEVGFDSGKAWDALVDYKFVYDPAVSDPSQRASLYMDGDFVSYVAGDPLADLGWWGFDEGRAFFGAADSANYSVTDWSFLKLSTAPGLPAFALIGVMPLAAGLTRRLRRR